MKTFSHVLIGLIVSTALMVGLAVTLLGSSKDFDLKDVASILRNLPLWVLGVTVLSQLLQGFFRALRYQLLLLNSGDTAIPTGRMLVITYIRNMFVDLLPARTGELVYVWLVRKVARRNYSSGFASLGSAFVFDIVALATLVPIVILVTSSSNFSDPQTLVMMGVLGAIAVVGYVGFFVIAPVVWNRIYPMIQRFNYGKKIEGLLELADATVLSIQSVTKSGRLLPILALSMAVRFFKYFGIVLMLYMVLTIAFMQLELSRVSELLVGVIAGEAFAGLPIPNFMSFGTYEAGTTATLSLLGYSAAAAVVAIFIVHIFSQIVDYSMGLGCAFLAWVFGWLDANESDQKRSLKVRTISAITVTGVGAVAAGLVAFTMLKRPADAPPSVEVAEVSPSTEISNIAPAVLPEGFIVWASNRTGNHEIYKQTLPSGEPIQITKTDAKEFYPSISPDGKSIVFMRSMGEHPGSFSVFGWQAVVRNLESGEETLVANNAYHPSWVPGTTSVVYTVDGHTIMQYDLASEQRQVLVSPEINGTPTGYHYYTTNYRMETAELVTTVRGARRTKLALDFINGKTLDLPGGCQLIWMPKSDSMIYVAEGGNGGNRIAKIHSDGSEALLLDIDGPYSHEYFPRVTEDAQWLIYGASTGGHEHDEADYEVFLWKIGSPEDQIFRLTEHPGNDSWADIHLTN
jgi:uncharacterized membrane protein YbhN (UPF0104 family)